MIISFNYGDVPMIALYNKTQITEQEAREELINSEFENPRHIVLMTQEQYEFLKNKNN